MRLTLFGARAAVFYVAIVGAYFAAPYVNLFFLALAFLTALLGLGVLWSLPSVRGVTVCPPRQVLVPVGGGSVACRLEGGRRRRFDVGVEWALEAPGGGRRRRVLRGALAVLRAGSSASADVLVEGLPRGVYPVVRARLVSTHPFGLVQRRVPAEGPREVVVHPRPTSFGESGTHASAEDWLRELHGGGDAGDLQPAALRDRREGDSLRAVHWRASARRGRPVVIEWEGAAGEGLEVALDRRCTPGELEDALGDLAALVQLAREGKRPLSIATQGTHRTFGEGHASWDAALRLLAELEPLPPAGPAPPTVPRDVPVLPLRRGRAAEPAPGPSEVPLGC